MLAVFGVGDTPGKLSDWQAFALGVVQGATELLPVSSSGHLILVPWLAGWDYLQQHPDFNKTFDVALHLGTLIAVVLYFWADVVRYTTAWFRSVRRRRIETVDERIAWYIAAATVPAAIAGAAGESFIEDHLGDPWQIAIAMALFAILLWLADRLAAQREIEDIGWRGAIGVGLAQCLALLPGVSRSGVTITAGRFLRLDRDDAARFAFLLLIPIVFGAAVLKGVKDVALDGPAAGLSRPVRRRRACSRGRRDDRDLGAARLRPPAHLHGLRRLQARAGRSDRDRHPVGLAQQDVLSSDA